jgi:outer membrane protein OmpA-like peptidoglycan-associated protein
MKRLLSVFVFLPFFALFAQNTISIQVQGQKDSLISFQEKNDQSLFLRIVDDSSRAVENVTKDMVKIRKEGTEVRILSLSPLKTVEDVNQKIVLILDNSSSMHNDVDALLASLDSFLKNLTKASEVSIILFDDNIDASSANPAKVNDKVVKLRQLAFTNDFTKVMQYCKNKITTSLTRTTYLYDAVLLALQTMSVQPKNLQKSIVILSDGEDTGSAFNLDTVLHGISGIDYKVYAVDFSRGKGANKALAQMIHAADGRLFEAKQPDELILFFADISKQITTVYLVTYKLPSPPFGSINFRGDSLHIETQNIMDESPLLNYVFFDSAAAELGTNYYTFDETEDTAEFDETAISQPMDKYYHLLNIVGARMRLLPEAKLLLTGCNCDAAGEKNNLELSRQRAQSVADYLRGIWNIDSTRIAVEARNLPLKPSSTRTPEGLAENRRVEITSNDDRILRPVKSVVIEQHYTPAAGEFTIDVHADDGLRDWQFVTESEGSSLFSANLTNFPSGAFYWNWLDDQGNPISDISVINYHIVITDREGVVYETVPAQIPVTQQKREDRARSLENDQIVERYSLILFDFNSSTFGQKNKEMLDKVKASFSAHADARIDIFGFTDSIGDEVYNERLSKQRAQGVFDELKRAGIAKDKLTVTGQGENNSPFSNDTPEGRFLNRTVQVYVSYPAPSPETPSPELVPATPDSL